MVCRLSPPVRISPHNNAITQMTHNCPPSIVVLYPKHFFRILRLLVILSEVTPKSPQHRLWHCQRVLHFMGREVTGRYKFRCKLSNGWSRSYEEINNCFFLQEIEWSRSYRGIKQHPNLPWNFTAHGFLDPISVS